MSNFMGLDGFVWFTGVVEDRNDPDQIGRVRVRCLGIHTEDQNSIPTSDLPWAHVMHPVTDPSMHGMGSSPTFLVEGSWAVGFFRDGKASQQPVVMGTLPGVPMEFANFREGFNDPRHKESTQLNEVGNKPYAYNPTTKLEYGPYPLGSPQDTAADPAVPFTRDSGHTYGEPDTNRLARGSVSETHKSLIKRRISRLFVEPHELQYVFSKHSFHKNQNIQELRPSARAMPWTSFYIMSSKKNC